MNLGSNKNLIIRYLGIQPYFSVWQKMKEFTANRTEETCDEVWVLEHFPVYTQGQAGKPEHILNSQSIPIVQSDRGGQVTFHGPGQLVAYFLINLQKRGFGIRSLVKQLENTIISLLQSYKIEAHLQCGAPGVYVHEKKIASIGLRVKKGCTYHGIALNVAMDLSPFQGINPCGFEKLEMTQIREYIPDISIEKVRTQMAQLFLAQFTS